jgi:hypothetical protein
MFIDRDSLEILFLAPLGAKNLGFPKAHFAPPERGGSFLGQWSINISPLCGEGRFLFRTT